MTPEPLEHQLPVELLEKSIQSGSEYGWRQNDVLDVIEAARKAGLAIEGGLVQYVFEEGTCELYWLHYFTDEIKKGENFAAYANRTAREASERFKKVISGHDIKKEALDNFELVRTKAAEAVNIEDFKLFIISFEDKPDRPIPVAAPESKPKNKHRRKR